MIDDIRKEVARICQAFPAGFSPWPEVTVVYAKGMVRVAGQGGDALCRDNLLLSKLRKVGSGDYDGLWKAIADSEFPGQYVSDSRRGLRDSRG